MASQNTLTANELRSLLLYDAETGLFWWRVRRPGIRQEGAAGTLSKSTGYVVIQVNGRLYKAHRLAWLYVYGCWPANTIDHINGKKADNRISNLRDVTHPVNSCNRVRQNRNNATGLLGVTPHPATGKFMARVSRDGRSKYLGLFPSADEAHRAYQTASGA